jgi:cytochrome c-type biogenesis protein CcmE
VSKLEGEESGQAGRRWSRRSTRLLVGGVIVAAAAIYLVLSVTGSGVAYYMTVDEAGRRGSNPRTVRVAGNVIGASITWDATELILRFEIADETGTLLVEYHGPRPDMLREGAEVVVQGRLGGAGVFEANQLILKCPSKYVEATPDG